MYTQIACSGIFGTMNNECVTYTSTSIAKKLDNDPISEFSDKISFIENRQQGNSRVIGEIRSRTCDVYQLCEKMQESIKSTNVRVRKVCDIPKKNEDTEAKIKELGEQIMILTQFMERFIDE